MSTNERRPEHELDEAVKAAYHEGWQARHRLAAYKGPITESGWSGHLAEEWRQSRSKTRLDRGWHGAAAMSDSPQLAHERAELAIANDERDQALICAETAEQSNAALANNLAVARTELRATLDGVRTTGEAWQRRMADCMALCEAAERQRDESDEAAATARAELVKAEGREAKLREVLGRAVEHGCHTAMWITDAEEMIARARVGTGKG